eukprot:7523283-Pyramimonas_sp.AAC.1
MVARARSRLFCGDVSSGLLVSGLNILRLSYISHCPCVAKRSSYTSHCQLSYNIRTCGKFQSYHELKRGRPGS